MLVVKNPPIHAGDSGDLGRIPGWRRSPGGGNNPTPGLLPGEAHGQRSLVAMVHGVTKSGIQLRDSMQAVRIWNIWKSGKHHPEEALLRNGINGLGFLTLFAYLYFSLPFQNHTMKSQAGIRSAVNVTGSYIRFAQTVDIPQCGGRGDV